MALAAVGAVWSRMGIFFGTNDDRVIAEALAGTIVQTPDPHVKLVNWLLAAPLCLLYGVAGRVPWYGLCLVSFHILSWMAIFYGILSCCGRKPEVVAGVGLGCGCFLINLYSLGLIQFTSTAALLAIAGYVCLCLRQDGKGLWVFGGLELLAYLLRSDAMLMIQPLGGMVFLGLLWFAGGRKRAEGIKILVWWAGVVGATLALGAIGSLAGYHGTQWQEYERYNRARIGMFDYYGTPPYEEVKDILDRYQVTRTQYEAYCNYVMLEGEISPDCAEELASRAKAADGGGISLAGAVRQAFSSEVYRDPLSGGRVTATLWLCLVLWMVLSGQPKLAAPLLGLGIARTGVWCYIFYRGRVLPRVSYPLLFGESVFLLAVFVKSFIRPQKNKWVRGLALCLAGVFLVQGYRAGQTQYRYVKAENQGQAVYMEGLREIREYCRRYPARRFFLENGSFSFYKGSALETDIYQPANGMYTGGWNANTPVLREYLRTYFGDGLWEDFYLIIYDDGEPLDSQAGYAVVRYFEEKSESRAVLAERLTVSHGGSYLVWHFAAAGGGGLP